MSKQDYVSKQDASKEIFSEEDLLRDKVTSPRPTGSFQYEKCDKHPEVLTTYHCLRCDVAVCRDCIYTRQHSQDHQHTSERELISLGHALRAASDQMMKSYQMPLENEKPSQLFYFLKYALHLHDIISPK